MGLLEIVLKHIETSFIEVNNQIQEEKQRQELRKNSIDVEHRLISEEIIEKKLLR